MRFMWKTVIRLTFTAFTAVALIGAISAGEAAAVTEADCENGGGIVIHEMDGSRECIGGFYTGQKILF
jgi:hypothetical protein